MQRVLLVSKPLSPPWNDSGKNWARDVACYASAGVVHHVMVPRGSTAFHGVSNVVPEAIYRGEGAFAPAALEKSRTLLHLMRRTCDVVHLCFAPNPRTNQIARAAMRWRPRPVVHTVLSVPASFEGIGSWLFAERVVAVSADTASRLEAAGVRGVRHIPAAIPIPAPLRRADPARVQRAAKALGLDPARPVVLFPGDYEFSQAADTFAAAVERLAGASDACFVFACRIKQRASLAREVHFRHLLAPQARRGQVRFLRQLDDMTAVLALADVAVLPAERSYAKMDLPLVLLEALAQETPVILADVAPQREVLPEPAEAHGGLRVPPLDPAALADAVGELLRDPARRRRMGEAGRHHVIANHDAATVCARYIKIYQEIS